MKLPGGLDQRHTTHGRDGERGQILVLFTVVLIVILAFTALVIDLGVLRNNRQILANAVDAGALAGGTMLSVDDTNVAAANAKINAAVQGTYPGLSTPGDYQITYRCLVGIGAGNAGVFDTPDIDTFIPLDCDPSNALGHTPPVLGDFIGAGKTRSSDCRPDLGDRCNVVVVDGHVVTGFTFGRVVGVNQGDTGVLTSAACRGLCGELPNDDFDVVLTIDTSGSMADPANRTAGHTRLYWAQQAANQLLDELANARGTHQIGLVRYSGAVTDPKVAEILVPLTTDFTTVRTAIAGLVGSGLTPLKQGVAKGVEAMTAGDRPGATQVHILLSDGRPWPDNSTTRPTAGEITAYRDSADQVYSVLIGQSGAAGTANEQDPTLMRSFAKPNDTDHYLRVVDASNLPDVFRQIAVEILNPRSHLIQVYPPPIVSGVGGGGTVTITGKYFTGVTSVTFGGANASSFSVNSDTSITADPPNRPSGTTVAVRVTTQGGTSPAVDYTYP